MMAAIFVAALQSGSPDLLRLPVLPTSSARVELKVASIKEDEEEEEEKEEEDEEEEEEEANYSKSYRTMTAPCIFDEPYKQSLLLVSGLPKRRFFKKIFV